ncbi:three-Cys-motif partner protein TcmP [Pedobacter changchengzhani]|uniref:Three-Cys-motif partner protein TcmP n=1 Tax=Pedobacter changchengzhani TaxID=2529274 RepID=A0A4R5MM87_9SPHI|nr:three-Cys-motif partner protein TcmP [Pedobacter changchengzhani]TDG36385.1 three-Cys-motif partner protein TcmP [Pedobacter changchengzhani]
MKNTFGGNWTEAKMEIIVAYAKAYLVIMSKQAWAKTIYFDGFAGSGLIEVDGREDVVKGTSLRILDILEPKPFDTYYFVEKDEKIKIALENNIKTNYPDKEKNAHVVCEDCNVKLVAMANFLTRNKSFRALGFIDPYGMSVNWDSISKLKGLGIDLWILVPTGLGINRLLKNNGEISEAWLLKLEKFLGLGREEIRNHFYKTQIVNTLFGEETLVNKEKSTVIKAGELYKQRLNTVFKFVSEPFIMRNKTNSIMYHFMMATNNSSALQIANDVIKPKYKE